jgi:phage FluMu protein gp41
MMPEFECFVSVKAGAIVEASNSDEAKELYYNILMSELSAKDIVACEMEASNVQIEARPAFGASLSNAGLGKEKT